MGSSEQVWWLQLGRRGGLGPKLSIEEGEREKKLQQRWVPEADVVAARGLLFLFLGQGFDQRPQGQAEGDQ